MKPSLDIIIFTTQLARSLGARGTVLVFLNYYATARILRAVTPAFGRLAGVERGLEVCSKNLPFLFKLGFVFGVFEIVLTITNDVESCDDLY
jgi:ABC transporter transmembrane region 2